MASTFCGTLPGSHRGSPPVKGDGKALASGRTSLRWKKMVSFVKVVGLRGSGWSIGWSKENDGKHAAALSLILELSPMAIKERRF